MSVLTMWRIVTFCGAMMMLAVGAALVGAAMGAR